MAKAISTHARQFMPSPRPHIPEQTETALPATWAAMHLKDPKATPIRYVSRSHRGRYHTDRQNMPVARGPQLPSQ